MDSSLTKPTASLTVHPSLHGMPEWSDDDPQFEALCRNIHRRGIIYPILIDSKGKIGDGRHRYRAAKKLKLESVPVKVVSDDEMTAIIIDTLTQRRHYTKSALAYMLLPILTADRKKSLAVISEETGISERLIGYAIELRDIFADGKDGEEYKTEIEPKILSGEASLGAVVAGWAGRQATKGQSKKQTSVLQLWDRSLVDFRKRFTTWEKLDVASRNSVVAKVQTVFEAMPTDLLSKVTGKISSELKRRLKEKQS
jgi:hypothetical protein